MQRLTRKPCCRRETARCRCKFQPPSSIFENWNSHR